MKVKTVALLVVAVGCGLFAMLGVRQAMNGKNKGVQEEKVSVLMAVTEIPVGMTLTPENVMFKDVAVALVPEDAVTTEEQYADRAANKLISANNFITISALGEPGVRGASMAIPTGWRIVSVKVNDTQTHSGMLAPGDRVDVLVTYQSRGRGGPDDAGEAAARIRDHLRNRQQNREFQQQKGRRGCEECFTARHARTSVVRVSR